MEHKFEIHRFSNGEFAVEEYNLEVMYQSLDYKIAKGELF